MLGPRSKVNVESHPSGHEWDDSGLKSSQQESEIWGGTMTGMFSMGGTTKERNASVWLFLIGIFSVTQVRIVGSIGISELICFVLAPFLFMIDYRKIRHDGFMPAICLSILAVIGCCVSSAYNHSPRPSFLRGFAATYSIFAFLVVHHRLLRDNLGGMKWFLLGVCLSNVINIFIFRQSVETYRVGEDASSAELTMAVTSGVLFWLSRLGPFLTLPTRGWYFQTPLLFSVVTVMIMPVYTMATTDTGRSATVIAIGSMFLLLAAHKSLNAIKSMQRHVVFVGVVGVLLCILIKDGYKYLAENGYLNEDATRKYEGQMKQGGRKGVVGMLVGGRAEFFGGIYAAAKKPIWGYGPWAIDVDGIYGEFVSEYGNWEDAEKYARSFYSNAIKGCYPLMPAHSHIIGFWVQYGILGLILWIYVFYLIYKLLRRNLSAIPQWYGYFALTVCGSVWNILFSPYSLRVEMPFFITALLLADAVRRQRIPLSPHMVYEIECIAHK